MCVCVCNSLFFYTSKICGGRARVEMSHGPRRGRGGRFDGPSRRMFNPDDRCYNCGGRGHYAYDCSNKSDGGGRSFGGGGSRRYSGGDRRSR